MFRRLATAFDTGHQEAFATGHQDYLSQQNTYYASLPNVILSATSGLPGFDKAIQSTQPDGNGMQTYAVDEPNSIFRPAVSPPLAALAKQCETSSLDQLLASKSNQGIGCGWVYTPPPAGSPFPIVSQGEVGTSKAPLDGFGTPSYKQWFFDLQMAKKKVLLDKCKALQGCNDVDDAVYQGSCGYCTDTNQGVPIDSDGRPLYPSEPLGACSHVVRSKRDCPPPPPGPQPPRDTTCDPVNGRLGANCLSRNVVVGGCSNQGTLVAALRGASPQDSLSNLATTAAYQRYRSSNPTANLELFRQDGSTVNMVLQQVGKLATDARNHAPDSALGASARDLCFQTGALAKYNVCLNLADSTHPSMVDLACLQELFMKMGGQGAGSAYPTMSNLTMYQTMSSLGAIKQKWSDLLVKTKGRDAFVDYAAQRDAMIQMLGIAPEAMIRRAPFVQGIEVFWFVVVPGSPHRVLGFLKRTIETDVLNLAPGPSHIPQLGGIGCGCCVHLTDVRAPSDSTVRFKVTVDDGFWISVNRPADIDKSTMTQARVGQQIDEPGLFEVLSLQGPTPYQSTQCTPFQKASPNLLKIFYEDAGCGWNAFQFQGIPCSGVNPLVSKYYSLTCEARAPFLTYEVSSASKWEELRNPGLFSQFLGIGGPDYRTGSSEKENVPGKKSFMRLNGANSYLNMPNIAFQSWKSMSFAVRFQTMPVKETLCHIFPGGPQSNSFAVVAYPMNGSTATISVEHNLVGGSWAPITTNWQLSLGTWYLFYVNNKNNRFEFYCDSMDNLITRGGKTDQNTYVRDGLWRDFWNLNATWNPAPGQNYQPCNVLFSGGQYQGQWGGVYGTSSFHFDLAWVHFFQQEMEPIDVVRECKADWIYTEFPK